MMPLGLEKKNVDYINPAHVSNPAHVRRPDDDAGSNFLEHDWDADFTSDFFIHDGWNYKYKRSNEARACRIENACLLHSYNSTCYYYWSVFCLFVRCQFLSSLHNVDTWREIASDPRIILCAYY